ncbi:MAG: protein kinase, partial [Deltaproteobacteria bacterium]|nr:protein kinase [Deltaproteobacteria bacterium]
GGAPHVDQDPADTPPPELDPAPPLDQSAENGPAAHPSERAPLDPDAAVQPQGSPTLAEAPPPAGAAEEDAPRAPAGSGRSRRSGRTSRAEVADAGSAATGEDDAEDAEDASATGGTGRRRRQRRDTSGRRATRNAGPPTGKVAMAPTSRVYDFRGMVGEGAMGQVLRAQDTELNRVVAFKVMNHETAAQGTMAAKFSTEVQITAQLEHPNIIPVYALEATEDGSMAYTMKLVKGRTFEHLIEETRQLYLQRKPIDEAHALTTRLDHFLKVCDALHYAHAMGVLHRDLKPENIMLGTYNEVYVMDWGISRLMFNLEGVEEPVQLGSQPDEGDMIIGTAGYMSPEQADARHAEMDGRSDQYSLGLILFELISLRQAVTGKTPIAMVTRQQMGETDPLVHITKEKIPPELKAIVAKATSEKPAGRYRSVAALAEDIRRYLRNEAVKARRDSPLQAITRWLSNHRTAALFAIGALFTFTAMIVLGSISFQLWQSRQQSIREENLSHLLTTVGTRSAEIDGNFVKYEGLLYYVAASGVEALSRAVPGNERVFTATDFDNPGGAPADFETAKRYGQAVSFDFPVHQFAGDEETTDTVRQTQLLASLHRTYRRAQLRSHSEEAAVYTPQRARRLVADVGTPIAYTSIGLENGVFSGYPGRGGFAERFDARKAPWYKLAKDSKVPLWGTPYVDDAGLGLILPCATGLYDDEEHFLGVAAIELTFDYLIDKLLETEELKDVSESYLLDREGRVVVDSSKKGRHFKSAIAGRTIRMPEFDVPEVVENVKALQSGHVEVRRDGVESLVLYNRMQSLGWYYVVVGETDAMFEASQDAE